MNELKFTGIITAISAKQSGESANGKHWDKQNFVVTEQKDRYPQSLLVEAFNKSEIISKLQEGDEVEVKFMGYDDRKKMKLSRKVLLPRPPRPEQKPRPEGQKTEEKPTENQNPSTEA